MADDTQAPSTDEYLPTTSILHPLDALDLTHLTLSSTLADLPTHRFTVKLESPGRVVRDRFEDHPHLPGVIVVHEGQVVTAVSRQHFLSHVGQQQHQETYLLRPLEVMVEELGREYLELSGSTTVQDAVEAALARRDEAFYEPIVVIFPRQAYRLLDVYVLLLGQTQLLRRVHRVEQNRRQLAESLQKTGRVLVSSLSLDKVTHHILNELEKVVPYDQGLVLLHEEEQLVSLAQRGFPSDMPPDRLSIALHPGEEDLFQRLLTERRPLRVNNVNEELGDEDTNWLPRSHSWLGVPLLVQHRVIGLLFLTRRKHVGFTEDDVPLVEAFASQAAVALDNAHLYERIVELNNELEQRVAERTQELHDAYAVLEKLDQSKADFINVAAHELRTPLTVITGYAQILRQQAQPSAGERTIQLLNGILNGSERLQYIVNSMLDVARIDNKTLKMAPRDVALADVWKQVVGGRRSALQARGLDVTVEGLADLPLLKADPALLEKAFSALLTNAMKFTPDGGRIRVRGEVDGEGMVTVMVEDTGIGIEPEQLDLIFEKFYQTGELSLHSSSQTKFKGGGPGLGLAIARGIVQMHAGEIWAESEGRDEGNYPGSRFYVRLPAAK